MKKRHELGECEHEREIEIQLHLIGGEVLFGIGYDESPHINSSPAPNAWARSPA